MPKYKVKARSWIEDRIREVGEEVDFAGEPGDNLEPVDDAALAAVAAVKARREQKAAAIAAGASAILNPETAQQLTAVMTELQQFAGRLAGIEARVAAAEAGLKPDLTPYALRTDVTELDQGMTLLAARVTDVEGTLAALAAKAQVPPPPPPAAPAPSAPADPVAPAPVDPAAPAPAPADPAAPAPADPTSPSDPAADPFA